VAAFDFAEPGGERSLGDLTGLRAEALRGSDGTTRGPRELRELAATAGVSLAAFCIGGVSSTPAGGSLNSVTACGNGEARPLKDADESDEMGESVNMLGEA
jgi:hypothetical protein